MVKFETLKYKEYYIHIKLERDNLSNAMCKMYVTNKRSTNNIDNDFILMFDCEYYNGVGSILKSNGNIAYLDELVQFVNNNWDYVRFRVIKSQQY